MTLVTHLLLNGSDGSTTITDEVGKTWTANGNAQIDTAQYKFGGASLLLDGTGDDISTADSADWQLDGGSDSNQWTIATWIRFNGDPGTGAQGICSQAVDGNNLWGFRLNNNNLVFTVISGGTTIVNISNAWNPADATWYHVALVKNGTSGYMMFIDGTQIGTTQTDTSTIPNFAAQLRAGSYFTANYLNGWMDDFLIDKGTAIWTSNFTPPSTEYGAAPSSGFFMFF